MVAIAAPILDYTGQVVAAVNVVGPSQRINQFKPPIYIKRVVRASKEISDHMGYMSR